MYKYMDAFGFKFDNYNDYISHLIEAEETSTAYNPVRIKHLWRL